MRSPIIVLAIALALAAPAVANAAGGSITYVKDGHVFVVSPDGATSRQITTDNAGYISPTAKDDGTIVVGHVLQFSVFSPAGARLGGPFTAEDMNSGCNSAGPITAQIEPQGSRIVYSYFYNSCSGLGYTPYVAFAHSGAPTPDAAFPEFNPYSDARWIGSSPTVAAIHEYTGVVSVFGPGAGPGSEVDRITPEPGEHFASVDFARNGQDALLLSKPIGASEGPGVLTLWRNGTVCRLAPFAEWSSKPRWSPDGTAFTWSDAQGVWVSPAPSGSGTCAIAPKLIVPGGAHPDWGAAAIGGKPTLKLARIKAPKLATALRKGFKVKLTSNEAGKATVTASVSSKDARRYKLTRAKKSIVVAKATKTLRASRAQTIKLRFTTKARKQLRGAKRVKLKVQARVTDAAGNRGTVSRSVTLRAR